MHCNWNCPFSLNKTGAVSLARMCSLVNHLTQLPAITHMYGLPDLFMYLSWKSVTKALVTFATLILSDPYFLGKAHSTNFNLLVFQCIGRLFESCWCSILKCPSLAFCWFLSVPLLSTSILCLFVCLHYFVDQKHVQLS